MKALPGFWLRRTLLSWLLLPVSLLFGLLSASRRLLFRIGVLRTETLPVPVIVVGNIFVGGTGKTPFVIWLTRLLASAGYRPGVISRGYGGKADTTQRVRADTSAALAGDEPVLIASRSGCPVVVGRNRVAAARHLLREHPDIDVIVSDDGLQHYRLPRTLEVAIFDDRGIGNGWLLPAGPLREPVDRRRDFTVINGAGAAPGVTPPTYRMQLVPGNAWQLADPEQHRPLPVLGAGKRLLAAAGIGNPQRFFSMLEQIGLQFEAMPLPDHHDFADDSFQHCGADIILITEKDAVKCRLVPRLARDARLWVVPVTAALDEPLNERILERLRGSPPARHPGLPDLQAPA